MSQVLHHHTQRKISSGRTDPLGATPITLGVNFAVFSAHADGVFLLLFDSDDSGETDCIKLFRTKDIWHVFVQGIGPGQLYAYKVRGRYEPAKGMRFNEHKLLIDPYAKALSRKYGNDPSGRLYGYNPQSPKKDLVMDTRENMCKVPRCIVVDDAFDWQNEKRPAIPMEKLIVYEAHVKGLTQHRSSGVKDPGTYLGLIEKIPYLKSLGINCVELLPVQEFFIRQALIDNGLNEYWGYNTLAFFAPESSYASGSYPGCQVNEFKTMVRQLHKAGIEVILDVVYNHTAEGNELGPTLSFKGLDNIAYYALRGTALERYRSYVNHSGCGNTINAENPMVVKMVVDSLRYWAQTMHVDGFRFDLAPVLFRRKGVFHPNAAFYRLLLREPVFKHVKFIAEPWDMSTYQLGKFPPGWSEWNGKFRDALRCFVKGEPGWSRETARRMAASADIYGRAKKMPFNSVNFITCHDGFTLYDLFSYNTKHNEANAENNKDGSNDNHSWNCGTEGETDSPQIAGLRRRLIKNALCCLFFSMGTPMLLGGDEFLRTQRGNNNAYCQDNALSWFDWSLVEKNSDIFGFCRKAIALRKKYAVFQNKSFPAKRRRDETVFPHVRWFGKDLKSPHWEDRNVRIICCEIDGRRLSARRGNYVLFLILNSHAISHMALLPQYKGMRWHRIIDTALEGEYSFAAEGKEPVLKEQGYYEAQERSVVLLIGKKQGDRV